MFNSLHKARNPSIVARGLLTEQGQCVSLSCCVVFAKVSTQCAVLICNQLERFFEAVAELFMYGVVA